jgi:hypothetical protein
VTGGFLVTELDFYLLLLVVDSKTGAAAALRRAIMFLTVSISF